ncbi:MAG: GntG family PLP-dependent aldolase [Bacteroidia bacterium]|nr:GntG family PLP-dependent aldolase [Bacteroidia bacterium]
MRAAMLSAPVGDDVYGEDPTVTALEHHLAGRFGMEAALFCSSGTQTNQIALFLHAGALGEVICHQLSHVYYYEGGGIAFNSRASVALVPGDRGRLTAEAIAHHINPDDVHRPITRCVALENTANRGGGACYELAEIERIHALCRERGLKLHLDGARLFNAIVAKGEREADYGRLFDSISICLSKGLGAPVGSLLLGSTDFIRQARRVRKVLGGGWRQAGLLAAAGLYALEHHVARLADDHQLAQRLGHVLAQQPYVAEVLPVETNIVLLRLTRASLQQPLLAHLKSHGILANGVGSDSIRLVTHLDVPADAADTVATALGTFEPAPPSA